MGSFVGEKQSVGVDQEPKKVIEVIETAKKLQSLIWLWPGRELRLLSDRGSLCFAVVVSRLGHMKAEKKSILFILVFTLVTFILLFTI